MGLPRLPAVLLLLRVGPRTWAPEPAQPQPSAPLFKEMSSSTKLGPLGVGPLGVGGLEKGVGRRGERSHGGEWLPRPPPRSRPAGKSGLRVSGYGTAAERLSDASQPSHLGWAHVPWRPQVEGCFSQGPARCLAGLDCGLGCSAHRILKGECLTGTPPNPTSSHPHQGQETSLKEHTRQLSSYTL